MNIPGARSPTLRPNCFCHALTELLKEICTWAEMHFAEVEQARVDYDHKAKAGGS